MMNSLIHVRQSNQWINKSYKIYFWTSKNHRRSDLHPARTYCGMDASFGCRRTRRLFVFKIKEKKNHDSSDQIKHLYSITAHIRWFFVHFRHANSYVAVRNVLISDHVTPNAHCMQLPSLCSLKNKLRWIFIHYYMLQSRLVLKPISIDKAWHPYPVPLVYNFFFDHSTYTMFLCTPLVHHSL